jgi:hypothetical protein
MISSSIASPNTCLGNRPRSLKCLIGILNSNTKLWFPPWEKAMTRNRIVGKEIINIWHFLLNPIEEL